MKKRLSMPRRLDPTLVLAVLLPLLAAGAFVGLDPTAAQPRPVGPATTDLTSSSVVCPPSIGGHDTVGAATAAGEGVSGTLSASPVGRARVRSVEVASGSVGWVHAGSKPLVITGAGAVAPGLVAGRSSTKPLTALDCPVAGTNLWFAAAGSGPSHDSVVRLVNPNDGPAVVDLSVLGTHGPVPADALAGMAVPGHSTQTVDLGTVIPQPGPLALHAVVQRGQLAVAVEDERRPLVDNKVVGEWLASSAPPQRKTTVLGLPPHGEHTLVVANSSHRQISATLKLVTTRSTVSPSGAPTLDIPPNGVASVSLDHLLSSSAAKGAIGVEVDAGGPVVASIRTEVPGDLALSPAGLEVSDATAAVVPPGPKQLVLAGASGIGAVTVTSIGAQGKTLATKRVSLTSDAGAQLDLPDKTVLVQVAPERATLLASILVTTSTGDAVVPLRPLVRNGLVPAVRPALP